MAAGDLSKLLNGFVVYFADNVLVMLMATTAGTLGLTLFSQVSNHLVLQQLLGVLVNTVIATVMYFVVARLFHDAKEIPAKGDFTDEEAETKRSLIKLVEYGVDDVKAGATTGYSHILSMLPWIIIVPMVNVPIVINQLLEDKFASEPHFGKLWTCQFAVFMIFLVLALGASRFYANRNDSGAECESYPTFILNSLNHSLLSSTGKSVHLLELVTCEAVVGKELIKTREVRFVEIGCLTCLTWFLLDHTWPRLREDTLRDKLFKASITTITVYAWAYALINSLWEYFVTYVENGQMWYWLIMAGCLLMALLLGYVSSLNFYGGPSTTGAAFGLMLCWVVDFGFWWGWSQVMTDIDNAATDGDFYSLLLVNGGVLVALLMATSFVYIFASRQTLAEHSLHRNKHTLHHQVANHTGKSRASRASTQDSDSDGSE